MDTVLILTGIGVGVAAVGVAATVVIWVLRGVFNLGGLHMKVDALDEKIDVKFDALSERVDALDEKVDVKFGALSERVDTLSERVDVKFDVLSERVDTLSERVDVKFDALNEKVDVKVGALADRVDDVAEGQRRLESKIDTMQGDLNRVINALTALANHRHDVDGNIVFNVPPDPG